MKWLVHRLVLETNADIDKSTKNRVLLKKPLWMTFYHCQRSILNSNWYVNSLYYNITKIHSPTLSDQVLIYSKRWSHQPKLNSKANIKSSVAVKVFGNLELGAQYKESLDKCAATGEILRRRQSFPFQWIFVTTLGKFRHFF